MDKNLYEWLQICKAFCNKKGYKLLFVNSDNFGFEDKKGGLHHIYAEELIDYLKEA